MGSCCCSEYNDGMLYVRILEARGLSVSDEGGVINPYCKIELLDLTRLGDNSKVDQTPYVEKDDTPMWNYTTSFKLSKNQQSDGVLLLTVMDKKTVSSDVVIGMAKLKCSQLKEYKPVERWLELKAPKDGDKRNKSDAQHADVYIRVIYTSGPVPPVQQSNLFKIQPRRDDSNEPYSIQAYCLTFNCGNADSQDVYKWIPVDNGIDLYIIAHQEMYESSGLINKARDMLARDKNYTSELQTELVRLMLDHLNEPNRDSQDDYYCLANGELYQTRLFIFCKRRFRSRVSSVRLAREITGIGNFVANKGGAACSFNLDGTSFGVVGCHLAAHQDEDRSYLKERNEDYKQICGNKARFSYKYHHVIWLGDMNYRMDYLGQQHGQTPNEKMWLRMIADLDRCRKQKNYDELLQNDELARVIRNNDAFYGFREGRITFAPTFKLDTKRRPGWERNGADGLRQSYLKKRLPAYTDRILYKSHDSCRGDLKLQLYGSREDVVCSDHTPVFARMSISVRRRQVCVDDECKICYLNVLDVAARGLHSVKNGVMKDKIDPYLFVPKQALLYGNKTVTLTATAKNNKNPKWGQGKEHVVLVRNSLKYLENVFLYLHVKDEDDTNKDDVAGYVALSLREFVRNSNRKVTFVTDVISQGLKAGEISGTAVLVWESM